jgi:hypothetical protein
VVRSYYACEVDARGDRPSGRAEQDSWIGGEVLVVSREQDSCLEFVHGACGADGAAWISLAASFVRRADRCRNTGRGNPGAGRESFALLSWTNCTSAVHTPAECRIPMGAGALAHSWERSTLLACRPGSRYSSRAGVSGGADETCARARCVAVSSNRVPVRAALWLREPLGSSGTRRKRGIPKSSGLISPGAKARPTLPTGIASSRAPAASRRSAARCGRPSGGSSRAPSAR